MRLATLAILLCAATADAAPSTNETAIHAGPLSGSMLGPKTAGAAMLIIPGSGPTDRDGNNLLGVKGSPYKVLAQALAERGITTVRIDKRGMFGSSRALADPNAVTISDYAADVHAWIKVIRKETGSPCVWVAGHSEGGLVALVSGQNPDGICGLVLLAAPGRPAGEVLLEQMKQTLPGGPMLRQATLIVRTLEAGRRPNVYSMHPALQELFAPRVQGLLISMFSYDPANLIAQFHKPVLILQGERDLQVSVEDAKRLKQAAPEAKLVLLPDANHVFKTVKSADTAVNKAAYLKPGVPLVPGLPYGIADFVLTKSRAN
jgi:uncharacterized protein